MQLAVKQLILHCVVLQVKLDSVKHDLGMGTEQLASVNWCEFQALAVTYICYLICGCDRVDREAWKKRGQMQLKNWLIPM